jgi:hypothetical protein
VFFCGCRILWQSDKDKIYFRVQAKTREDDFAAVGFVEPRSRTGQFDETPGSLKSKVKVSKDQYVKVTQ